MEIYRKEMDKKILEQLKDKIIIYLKSRGFQKSEFIRENLDKVAGLYVENMIERDGPKMQSRSEKSQTVKENGTYKVVKKPSEIAIDKGFVLFDENDNPIGIDANVKKLIMTQLTHELIHSGSGFDGHSGIKTTKQNTGLDEGMTQMFTEKIWGYTLSPNSDSKYKDYKKIAKILDATFEEQVSIDAYFNHSDALENACNSLSQNNSFYSDMNKYLTSAYDMRKAVPKDIRDKYYQTIMQPISNRMINLVYDKVCAEIVIPKIKTMSKAEQRKYLHDILDSVKDEPTVLNRFSATIVRYANMTEEELEEEIKGIDSRLQQAEREKQFVVDVYKSSDCSKLVEISEDGTIRTIGENPFIIQDESLKEKIFAQLYFQERQGTQDEFANRVSDFYTNKKTEFRFSKSTPINRKKVFSAMKVVAREQGHFVLNSLEECESGESIQIRAVEAQKGKAISFQDLKSIYQKFDIFYRDDDYMQMSVMDRATGNQITDPQIVAMGKFAAIWGGAAGTKWIPGEEIRGITYAFNDGSERVFSTLGELIGKSMTENGKIDTETLYKAISADQYKYSEEIIRTLLSNPISMKIVYDFYKMQNDNAKLETRLEKTINEVLFGYSQEDRMVEEKTEEVMNALPDFIAFKSGKGSRGQGYEQVIGKSEAQILKEETDKAAKAMAEQISRELEAKTSDEANKGKISGAQVKQDITEGKVRVDEEADAESIIAAKRERAKLLFKASLSPEEQLRLEELNRQFQRMVDGQQQGNKKGQGIGI